ncbi:hypothetical protein Gpo141_00008239, partial [Globisporangium polare]
MEACTLPGAWGSGSCPLESGGRAAGEESTVSSGVSVHVRDPMGLRAAIAKQNAASLAEPDSVLRFVDAVVVTAAINRLSVEALATRAGSRCHDEGGRPVTGVLGVGSDDPETNALVDADLQMRHDMIDGDDESGGESGGESVGVASGDGVVTAEDERDGDSGGSVRGGVAEESECYDEDSDGYVVMVGVVEAPVGESLRVRRPAAFAALSGIAEATRIGRQKDRAPSKRARHDTEGEEEEEENDVAPFMIAEVAMLVERCEETPGVFECRAKWKNVAPGDDEYSWLGSEDLSGCLGLKDVIDRWYEAREEEPALAFHQFWAEDFGALTMGDNYNHTCVYVAVRKVIELQGSDFVLTDQIIARFEAHEKVDRMMMKGLNAHHVQRFFEYLVTEGWRSHFQANLYRGGGHGNQSLALLAGVPGIYFVGTVDSHGAGHCLALKHSEKHRLTVYEGGASMGLGQYKFPDKIRW